MPAISKNTAPGCWRWWKNLPLKPVNKFYEKAFYKTENNCGINPALHFATERGLQSAGMLIGQENFGIVRPRLRALTFLRDKSRAPVKLISPAAV
jgi:hypothetical protein